MIIKNKIQLEVKYIDEIMGFGVFASQDIDEGIIVETCYCVKTYNQPFNPCFDYLFQLTNTEALLPFGYGSIYNHSCTPNVHYYFESDCILVMYALRDIKEGEELCHNYGRMYWKTREKKLL